AVADRQALGVAVDERGPGEVTRPAPAHAGQHPGREIDADEAARPPVGGQTGQVLPSAASHVDDALATSPLEVAEGPAEELDRIHLVAVDRLAGRKIGVVSIGRVLDETAIEPDVAAHASKEPLVSPPLRSGSLGDEPWRPAPSAKRLAPSRVSPERM